MRSKVWRWGLGLTYIIAVAIIWIAASFVVQSVVDAGVSPFLITYICNSLFVVYIPLTESGRYLEDTYGSLLFWRSRNETSLHGLPASEEVILLGESDGSVQVEGLRQGVVVVEEQIEVSYHHDPILAPNFESSRPDFLENLNNGLDAKGRWTRTRVAKVSLLVCPFWFLAQLTFNISLKYTTVTSNTILSSASSLFTFLVSLAFLGEMFTWVKLISVLLCMGGTIIVSLADSETGSSSIASNPFLGDILALLSAAFYSVYITLIRKHLPDDDDGKNGRVSMAQFLGFLGLFNFLIFLPVVLVLNFTKLEPFDMLTGKQFSLIVGKGLLDNVLSDYLWAKAVLLTTTTVATAGLTIQVPLAAVVDSVTGNAPNFMDYIGAAAVMVGFAGINIPSGTFSRSKESGLELENGNHGSADQDHLSTRDAIAADQTIRDGETIVSAGGNFELGFISPGSSKSRFLGIWYKKISTPTIVWIANRETPIDIISGLLKLDNMGNLVLFNGSTSIIWSSNSSRSGMWNPVAQLLDTGNLVIRDESTENFFWQSFDYPGNTLMPGAKLGRDLATGLERSVSSWRSDNDPSPGNYKFQLDISGYPQLFLRKNSTESFRFGPWNGVRFSGMPSFGPNPTYRNEFVLNEQEIYYKYELVGGSASMRVTMDPGGRAQRFTWINRTQDWQLYLTYQADDCNRYALCGPYGSCDANRSPPCECLKGFEPKFAQAWENADWTGGCVRNTQLSCGNGDAFVKYSEMKLPDTRHSWFNVSMNLEDCNDMCLKNCSCTAYTNTDIRGSGSGCLLWFDDLIDIGKQKENPQEVYVRMPASENDNFIHIKSSSRVKRLAVIIVIPTLLVITALLGLCVLYVLKYRKQMTEGRTRLNVVNIGANENNREDLALFDFRTIAKATNNFSSNCKLGEGGFGPVYKGVLDGGQEIAVKRLSEGSRQGSQEFKNEVSCIAKLQHRNLVRLLGCSTAEGERMLIYEYMPNKSLDFFIFDMVIDVREYKEQRKLLDWPKRYNILNGIARGLLYLHHDSRLRIIHRDLKASNILLDYEMKAKISDFGMARSFGGSETEANTTKVVGTYGYMSPEYAIDGLFSIKSDVYSFGVLVLEIVSGKRNRDFYHSNQLLYLSGHAWRLYKEGKLWELIDEAIVESSDHHSEILRTIQIGLLCLQEHAEDRPNMSSVVLMLSSEIELHQPKQPGFFAHRKSHESDLREMFDSNQLSITYVAPR